MRTALMVVQLILSVGLIVLVTLQPSKGEGMGSIGGSAKLFFGKNKGYEELLAKLTKIFAAIFFVSSLVLAIVFRNA
jgi:preprotein translocase subunit SecG